MTNIIPFSWWSFWEWWKISARLPFFQMCLCYSRNAICFYIGQGFFHVHRMNDAPISSEISYKFSWSCNWPETFLFHLLKILLGTSGIRTEAVLEHIVMASYAFYPPKLPKKYPLNCRGKFLFYNALQVVTCGWVSMRTSFFKT